MINEQAWKALLRWQDEAMHHQIFPPPDIEDSKRKVQRAYQKGWYDAISNMLELLHEHGENPTGENPN